MWYRFRASDCPGRLVFSSRSLRVFACLGIFASSLTMLVHGQAGQGAPQMEAQPKQSPDAVDPSANRPLDANQLMRLKEQQAKRKSYDAANAERKRQLTEDSAQLLKLTGELRNEIANISSDADGVTLMRKIEEIERIAHNVQQKMKLTVGTS
jgi:hypothetical protein